MINRFQSVFTFLKLTIEILRVKSNLHVVKFNLNKRNENDKNINFLMKSNKKMQGKYM